MAWCGGVRHGIDDGMQEWLRGRKKVLDSLIANHGVVGTFHEGLAYVKIDGKIGYVDTTGKLVISPQFESEKYGFHDGMAAVEQGSKYGWIDG